MTQLHPHLLRHLPLVLLAWMAALSWPTRTLALSPAAELRCVRATVRIAAVGARGEGAIGSGVMIDGRGYLLTSFRVVGAVHPQRGLGPTLHSPENRFHVATVTRSDETARSNWIAAVVRADPELDLALLRIVSDTNGRNTTNQNFVFLRSASMSRLRANEPAWALGYAGNGRKLGIEATKIAGIGKNALGQPSWVRLQRALDAGFAGGPLVNRNGEILGIPSLPEGVSRSFLRYARPAFRMPVTWGKALRAGDLSVEPLQAPKSLSMGSVHKGNRSGDGHPDEPHVETLAITAVPEGTSISVKPRAKLSLIASDGSASASSRSGTLTLREGTGLRTHHLRMEFPDDRGSFVASIQRDNEARRANNGNPFGRKDAQSNNGDRNRNGGSRNGRNSGATSIYVPPLTGGSSANPFFTLPSTRSGGKDRTSEYDDRPNRNGGSTGTATLVSGRVVDAISGRALTGATFVIANPDVDVRAQVSRYLSRKISEAQFMRNIAGIARSDLFGNFKVSESLKSGRYPAAVFAPGYAPSTLTVRIPWHEKQVKLSNIELTK